MYTEVICSGQDGREAVDLGEGLMYNELPCPRRSQPSEVPCPEAGGQGKKDTVQ